MAVATETIVTILHERYWRAEGSGTSRLMDTEESQARDAAIKATTEFGDEVARVVESVLSDGLRSKSLYEEIERRGHWDDDDRVKMEAALEGDGII